MEPEEVLLTRLEIAFQHHQNDEAFTIRQSVSNYLRALNEDSENLQIPFPGAISGLRKHYLDAVSANATAKRRHTDAFNYSSQVDLNFDRQSTKPTVSSSRLELLREQKQYTKVEILENHARELGEIMVTNTESLQPTSYLEQERNTINELGTGSLVHDAQAKLSGLELAVVRERQKAIRERDLLQFLRNSDQSVSDVTASDQLRALEAVKRDLMLWLENGLATCSIQEPPNGAIQGSPTQETLHLVQETYDKYTLSRATLLDAVRSASISEPLSVGLSRINSDLDQILFACVEDRVSKIERKWFALEREQEIRQVQSYLDDSLNEEEAGAVELLQRLADESQLLPSYPMLSRLAKYEKTLRAIGSKAIAQDGNRVIEQTRGWEFAGNAANETTNASVRKHLKRGNVAIDEAQKSLKDLELLQDASTNTTAKT